MVEQQPRTTTEKNTPTQNEGKLSDKAAGSSPDPGTMDRPDLPYPVAPSGAR
jgi:hypothetical protein